MVGLCNQSWFRRMSFRDPCDRVLSLIAGLDPRKSVCLQENWRSRIPSNSRRIRKTFPNQRAIRSARAPFRTSAFLLTRDEIREDVNLCDDEAPTLQLLRDRGQLEPEQPAC